MGIFIVLIDWCCTPMFYNSLNKNKKTNNTCHISQITEMIILIPKSKYLNCIQLGMSKKSIPTGIRG